VGDRVFVNPPQGLDGRRIGQETAAERFVVDAKGAK
jgi:hypothetical protein